MMLQKLLFTIFRSMQNPKIISLSIAKFIMSIWKVWARKRLGEGSFWRSLLPKIEQHFLFQKNKTITLVAILFLIKMKNYYTKYLLVLLMALQTAFAISQEKPNLPHNLTETEKALVSEFQFTSPRLSPPPSGPVRAAAEWEEVEYLLVTWNPSYPNILRQIVQAGVEECKVIITTQNQATVSNY